MKAWRTIDRENKQGRAKDFTVLRTHHLLGRTDETSIKRADALYGAVNTFACQIGAALTLATIQSRHPSLTPVDTADVAVRSWNAALQGGPTQNRNRLCVLSKSEDKPLNMLSKMEGADAVYFRAMLLELMLTPEARTEWEGKLDKTVVEALVDRARSFYLDHLVRVRATLLKRTEPSLSEAKRKERARTQVQDELGDALKHWFGMRKPDYIAWLERSRNMETGQADDDVAEVAAAEAAADEAAAESAEPDPDELLPEDD